MNEVYINKNLDDIKRIDEYGNEYWKARELQVLMGYNDWKCFCKVIDKSMDVCKYNNFNVTENFTCVKKLIKNGNNRYFIQDYSLSRFACYIIIQNADPMKIQVARAQSYIAMQTIKYEFSSCNNVSLESARHFKNSLLRNAVEKNNIKDVASIDKMKIKIEKIMKENFVNYI